MSSASPYMNMATTLISSQAKAGGQRAEGDAAAGAKEFEAKTAMAKGTRKAFEAKREGDIVQSAARAAMAAGGGSASDASAIETLARIKQKAGYNALSALYEGEQAADISRYEGKIKKIAGRTRALSTTLSGFGKAFKSYKPSTTAPAKINPLEYLP